MHISIVHEIRDIGEFDARLKAHSRADQRAQEYHRYILELQKLRDAGSITAEEFRRRSDNWVASGETRS